MMKKMLSLLLALMLLLVPAMSLAADTTAPVITDVQFPQSGKTLKPGDTLNVSAKITDDSAFSTAVVFFKEGDEEPAFEAELTYNAQTERYEVALTIPATAADGLYDLRQVEAMDEFGNLKVFNLTDATFTIAAVKADTTGPVITNVELLENGKTLKPDDLINVTLKVQEENAISSLQIYLAHESGHEINLNIHNAAYDAETDTYLLYNPVPLNARPGEYSFYQIFALDNLGNSSNLFAEDLPAQSIIVDNDVTDVEGPVITNVTLVENGKTLKPGDTFTVKLTATDASGIQEFYGTLYHTQTDEPMNGLDVTNSYDAATGLCAFTTTIPRNAKPGEYTLGYVSAFDMVDNWTEVNADDFGKLWITVENDATDFDAPVVSNVTLKENGKTLKPGDTVTVEMKVEDQSELDYAQVDLLHDQSAERFSLFDTAYNAETGVYTLQREIPGNLKAGRYSVYWLNAADVVGNIGYEQYVGTAQWFDLENSNTDFDSPVISDVQFPDSGKTVKAGDTLTVRAKVTDASPLAGVLALFYFAENEDDTLECQLVYNAQTGYYEGKLTVPASAKLGRYNFHHVFAVDEASNSLLEFVKDKYFVVESAPAADTAAPEIRSIALYHGDTAMKTGYTLLHGQEVLIRVTVKDESPVEYVYVKLADSKGGTFWDSRLYANYATETFEAVVPFPATAAEGTYKLSVVGASDELGNYAELTGSKLADYAFSVSAPPKPIVSTETKVEVVEDIEEVPVVAKPVAVTATSSEAETLTLVATLYDVKTVVDTVLSNETPAAGTTGGTGGDASAQTPTVQNVVVYDLHLENQAGEEKQPNSTMVIYLPYPQGYDMNSNVSWKLRHYTDDFSSYKEVPLVAAEKGLRFETNGFSPFVLSWTVEKAPEAPAPTPAPVPQTGDSATPLLWMSLMALSGLCMLVLNGMKKRASR